MTNDRCLPVVGRILNSSSHSPVVITSATASLPPPLVVTHRIFNDPPAVLSSRPAELGKIDVVSLFAAIPCPKTKKFTIPTAGELFDSQPATRGQTIPDLPRSSVRRHTWIKPPADVIRLEDRLQYVLQPSLETALSLNQLRFPNEPFSYQLDGIAFLFPRHSAILADEMGLGKTMQTISTVRLLLHAREVRRVLIICPKPLVTNWQREFAHWAPEIPLSVIQGDQEKRNWQWRHPGAIVTLVNYEVVQRDADAFSHADVWFDVVVLDEAQRIKNQNNATSRAVHRINRQRSWALTGTPVENSCADLIGIFQFLAPGYLQEQIKPRELGRAVKDYILRRTKDKVLTDLPPKMFRDAEIQLGPAQLLSYEAAERDGIVQLTEMGDSVTIQHIFELILRLKQICNRDPVTGESVKLDLLQSDLEEIAASGKKAILFSQWVHTLEFIAERLRGYGPLCYHGGIPMRRRERVLSQFKQDPRHTILLMSYGAGGVGLNLQFCEYVFLFDRWWNPAVEDQAINRAHRIGAAGPVTVTRYITLNTIEERIALILEEKRDLLRAVFAEGIPNPSGGMTRDDVFGLFNIPLGHSPKRRVA